MKLNITRFSLFSIALLFFIACSPQKAEEKTYPPYNEEAEKNTTEGFQGIFSFPELLVISVTDSADVRNVATKVAKSYTLLGEEMAALNAEAAGAPGQIMYSNDPANFKFECFMPIKEKPVTLPATCKIYTLPKADMLIFNYYGPYQSLYLAYDEFRLYIAEHALEQKGEVREYYITDPTTEADSSKWLTRVMVPVAEIKKAVGKP